VSDQLSIGVGFSYVFGNVKLTERVPTLGALAPVPAPAANDGTVSLDGDGHDFNWNVGVLYKPTRDLSIGVSYRSETKVEFSGTAAFTDMQALQTWFPGGTGKTTLPFPSSLYAGIAYNFMENLTVEADIQLVGWSAYDKLLLNIPVGPASPLTGQPLQGPTTLVKNWKNSSLYRVGGEYRMDQLALRAGFIYDQTPQPDAVVEPMLPDANRIEFVVGLGYKFSDNFSIDGAFQFISFSDRTGTVTSKTALYPLIPAQNVTGSYQSSANLIGVDLSYNF
jgi:long-chain fatty acid transport protein